MLNVIRVTFLYIGTSIGAGFASGREIALFFGNLTPFNVAISALFMGALVVLFLTAGKLSSVPDNSLISTGISLSAFISSTAMLAGSETVIYSLTGVPMTGLIMGVAAAAIVVKGIDKIKMLNTLLVPLIIVQIILLFLKVPSPVPAEGFSLITPLMYSGLDVLLGGVVMAREGKAMTYKQIAATGVLCALVIGGILYMLQTVVLADALSSPMPVLAVAEAYGMQWASGILIAAAIFTTMVSSLDVVVDFYVRRACVHSVHTVSARDKKPFNRKLYRIFCAFTNPKNKALIAFTCLLAAYPLSFIGFELIVDACYPFISVCGIAFTLLLIIKTAAKCISRKQQKPLNRHEKLINSLTKTLSVRKRRRQLVLSSKA